MVDQNDLHSTSWLLILTTWNCLKLICLGKLGFMNASAPTELLGQLKSVIVSFLSTFYETGPRPRCWDWVCMSMCLFYINTVGVIYENCYLWKWALETPSDLCLKVVLDLLLLITRHCWSAGVFFLIQVWGSLPVVCCRSPSAVNSVFHIEQKLIVTTNYSKRPKKSVCELHWIGNSADMTISQQPRKKY